MTFLPIVGRELRVTAKKRMTYWLRSVAALAVILIFLCSAFGRSYGSPADRAKEMFQITSALVLTGCVFAGVFQTADCLSSEKRDGTLGLLFLTDLRGYDVVLGKLVSRSLNAIYGLLSILPVLGLPLLMGGVTAGEFWRVVLVLLCAVFFSLATGMVVSAVVRETRQALALTVFIMLLLAGVLPAVYAALKLLLPPPDLPVRTLLWPGLGYTYREALDDYYSSRTGHHEFWGSLLTVFGLACLCLLLASVILPRVWQEKGGRRSAWQKSVARLRFRSARQRRRLRAVLLERNPFLWLAVRDRLPRIASWLLALLALPLWLAFFFSVLLDPSTNMSGGEFEFTLFTTFAFSILFKFLVAAEATRRLCDDRQSGALELLLVTPLTERRMIAGQRRALWRHFWPPFLLVALLFLGLLWLMYGPVSTPYRDPVFGIMVAGNLAVLLTDFHALGWVGAWLGLRARTHPRAILGTLARVLFIPWLVYFLMGFSGSFELFGEKGFFVVWFLFGVFNDLFWAFRARRGLRKHFRTSAAGIPLKPRRRPVEVMLQPAAI
jgi:ABC-type transport system involved in cytochrome c biogenesis permease component